MRTVLGRRPRDGSHLEAVADVCLNRLGIAGGANKEGVLDDARGAKGVVGAAGR